MNKKNQRNKISSIPKIGSHEKFFIEIERTSKTFRLFAPLLRRKQGDVDFVLVRCNDGNSRQMIDPGWAFINKVDKAARLSQEFKGTLDFVIWSRFRDKPACILRSHGMYAQLELEQTLRESGTVL